MVIYICVCLMALTLKIGGGRVNTQQNFSPHLKDMNNIVITRQGNSSPTTDKVNSSWYIVPDDALHSSPLCISSCE